MMYENDIESGDISKDTYLHKQFCGKNGPAQVGFPTRFELIWSFMRIFMKQNHAREVRTVHDQNTS